MNHLKRYWEIKEAKERTLKEFFLEMLEETFN